MVDSVTVQSMLHIERMNLLHAYNFMLLILLVEKQREIDVLTLLVGASAKDPVQ